MASNSDETPTTAGDGSETPERRLSLTDEEVRKCRQLLTIPGSDTHRPASPVRDMIRHFDSVFSGFTVGQRQPPAILKVPAKRVRPTAVGKPQIEVPIMDVETPVIKLPSPTTSQSQPTAESLEKASAESPKETVKLQESPRGKEYALTVAVRSPMTVAKVTVKSSVPFQEKETVPAKPSKRLTDDKNAEFPAMAAKKARGPSTGQTEELPEQKTELSAKSTTKISKTSELPMNRTEKLPAALPAKVPEKRPEPSNKQTEKSPVKRPIYQEGPLRDCEMSELPAKQTEKSPGKRPIHQEGPLRDCEMSELPAKQTETLPEKRPKYQ